MSKPLTPYEWLFALALNLERGKIDVLDGFATDQHGKMVNGQIMLEWELCGAVITFAASWPRDYKPTGPIEIRGELREKIIRSTLEVLDNAIKAEIAARSKT